MLRELTAHGRARFAFTDRFGGRSQAPYDHLNLGGHVGDDPDVVAENRRLVAAEFGLPTDHVLYMNQVHGADVAVVDGPWNGAAPAVDALVGTDATLALAVLVADCVPVLLADPDTGVIGAAHAGRPGLAAGVVPAVVAAMRDLGADSIVAVAGPSVCGQCYEVPETMRGDVAAVVPEAYATTRWGTPALDLRAGVLAQLEAAGVHATASTVCTRTDPAFYSYRRDHRTGRFAGLVRLLP